MSALADDLSGLDRRYFWYRSFDRRAVTGTAVTTELCAWRILSTALRTDTGKSGPTFRAELLPGWVLRAAV
jgi:hypothetical protein